jgi:hypothetical protein
MREGEWKVGKRECRKGRGRWERGNAGRGVEGGKEGMREGEGKVGKRECRGRWERGNTGRGGEGGKKVTREGSLTRRAIIEE